MTAARTRHDENTASLPPVVLALHIARQDRQCQTGASRERTHDMIQLAARKEDEHAKAYAVNVELSKNDQDEHLNLSVRDDGIGFDAASVRDQAVRGASLGLLSMEERATLAGRGLEPRFRSGPRHRSPRLVPVKVVATRSLDRR